MTKLDTKSYKHGTNLYFDQCPRGSIPTEVLNLVRITGLELLEMWNTGRRKGRAEGMKQRG